MKHPTRRQVFTAMSAAVLSPMVARAERRLIANEYYEVTWVDVTLAGLHPSHDGLRIAQLSDLHIGNDVPDGRIISAVRAVNELNPDLVVYTGDFVSTRRDPVTRVQQLLQPISAPTVAVLGNHDHWSRPAETRKALELNGTTVLQNENSVFRFKGADLRLIGIDDSTTKNDDVEKSLKGFAGGSSLVLSHTPSVAKKLPPQAGLLCLSGHTHGGQFDVPKLTEGLLQTIGMPWYKGHYDITGNQLYVNRGLGFGHGTRLPRINSDPEVTILTLRSPS